MLRRWQQGGKSVQACGTPDECKVMHRALDPAKTMYCTGTSSRAEAEDLLKWFVNNT